MYLAGAWESAGAAWQTSRKRWEPLQHNSSDSNSNFFFTAIFLDGRSLVDHCRSLVDHFLRFQNPIFEAGRSEGGEIWFHIIWGNSTHLKTVRSDNDLRNALSTEIVNFGASVDFTSHKWSTTILPFVRVKTTLEKTGAGYPNHPFPIQRADTIQDKCMKPTECSPTSSGARGARFLKQLFANLGTVDHLSITCRSLVDHFLEFQYPIFGAVRSKGSNIWFDLFYGKSMPWKLVRPDNDLACWSPK